MLRNDCRRIIVGFQHQGIEQVPQPENISLPHPQMYLGHSRCIRGYGNIIIWIGLFQGKDTGHNLGGTCHGQHLCPVFLQQNTPVVRIHKDSGQGV